MQIEKLNIKNSTSNDFNPVIINNILASLNKATCLTSPLKLKYPPCKTYREKRVGGQLVALALSVAETAYDLATGVISWAQAGLNTLTSAVGAGVSWLGDVAGNAVKTVIGGVGNAAKTIGNVASSVAKNVVNTVGNVFNKGFYVNKDGGMDWHMNTSKWEHGFKAETLNFTSSLAGDITSDIIGYDTDPRTGKNIPKTFGFAGKDISINGLARSFASESVRAYNTGEFNVNIINAGIFMDAGDQMSWGTGFWGRMGHSMYLQDSDIAAARSFGLGVSFSKNGAKWKNKVSGGFDISDISHAAISRGADWAGEATGTKDFFNGIYDAAGSVSEAMYHGINNSLNFVHDKAVSGIKAAGNLAWSGVKAVGTGAYSLVQSEQGNPEQNKFPQTPYEKHSTNPRDAITEEERKKRKGFSQKEKDELKDYYKKAYNLDDDKAQTLIYALERGYIAQSSDKQYAEAGVSDIELHKKQLRITNIESGEPLNKRDLSKTNKFGKETLTDSMQGAPKLEISKIIPYDLSSETNNIMSEEEYIDKWLGNYADYSKGESKVQNGYFAKPETVLQYQLCGAVWDFINGTTGSGYSREIKSHIPLPKILPGKAVGKGLKQISDGFQEVVDNKISVRVTHHMNGKRSWTMTGPVPDKNWNVLPDSPVPKELAYNWKIGMNNKRVALQSAQDIERNEKGFGGKWKRFWRNVGYMFGWYK